NPSMGAQHRHPVGDGLASGFATPRSWEEDSGYRWVGTAGAGQQVGPTPRNAGVEPTGTYPRRVPHLAVRFLPSLEPPPPQPNKPKHPPSSHFIQPALVNPKQCDSMNPSHPSSSRNPVSPRPRLAQK